MVLAVVNQWPATSGDADNEVPITPTDGNWLVAALAWRTIDGVIPQMSVGDLKRNLWSLGRTAVNAAAGIGVQVWVCPVVKTYGGQTNVYVAPSFIGASDAGSVPVDVVEVSGVTGGLQIDATITGTADVAANIVLTAPAPGGAANCLMVAAAVVDTNTIPAPSGTGWTALTGRADSNPAVGLGMAWREATTGGAVTFTLAGSHSWAGVCVSIRAAGALPAVTPDWGVVSVEAQLALGYDQATPVSAMRWLTLSTLCQSIHAQRGMSAELGTAEASPNTFGWLNDQGSFTPRPAGSAVCTVAGTTGTAKISDVEAPGFTPGDFVRIQTYAGVLKEDTVFQVLSMPSSAGVTTVSFTPAAAASTAVGDVLVGVPVDVFVPVRTVATVDAKTYPVMVGASESLPQAWLDGTHGRVNMTAVDAYATLTAQIPNVLDGEILRGRPVEFWKLDEAAGAGRASNSARGSTTPLLQKKSKFGIAAASADFGASTQGVKFGGAATQVSSLFGSSASGWGQSGLVAADSTKGFALVGGSDSFPSISGGVTIVGICCMFTTQPTSGDATIMIIRNRDPAGGGGGGSIIKLSLDASANAAITVWNKDTHVSTRTLCNTGLNGPCIIGNSGWVPWAITFTRTSWTLYTAGSFFFQTGSCDLVAAFNTIDIGGEADASWNGHSGNAVHSRYAIYDRVLTPGEIKQIDLAAENGMSNSTSTDGTIRRQLSRAAWPGARILSRSDILTSEDTGLEGSAVGDVVSQVATWEDGLLGIDAAGYARFLSRDVLDRQTPKFVLGPNTGAGEIPYLGAPGYTADGQLLFTRIDVVNTAKIGSYLPGIPADRSGTFSTVAPLAATKGVRPRSWPTHLYRLADAYNVGAWLVARYGVPQLRITAVTVDPRATPGTAGWHAILGAEFGDVTTVKWAPGGAPAINTRCVIIGITHDATPSRWLATFVLMVAPRPGIILDDPIAGVISSGTLTL